MRYRFWPSLLGLLFAIPVGAVPQAPLSTGRLIVKFAEPPPPQKLLSLAMHLGATYLKGGTQTPYVLVKATGRESLHRAVAKGRIEYVEPELVMSSPDVGIPGLKSLAPPPRRLILRAHGIGAPASGYMPGHAFALEVQPSIPTDPLFGRQWGFQDSGYGLRLPSARRYTLGQGVIVAIVDTGVKQSLSDLARTEFLPGYNAITSGTGALDDNGHGTHIAGTIAQSTNNGLGCAGIAPAARILPIKVLNAQGLGSNYTIGVGIRYAVDHGAQVINLSIGGAASQTLKDAINYALNKGVTVVCAAGNGGTGALSYPARYAGVIAVGASDQSGAKASFSQYGPGLSLLAPGKDILQQTFSRQTGQSGYYYYSGTSMATPCVVGTVALLKSLSASLSPVEIKSILTGTARDVGASGWDQMTGAGLLDAATACLRVYRPGPAPIPPGPTPAPPGPEPIPFPPGPPQPEPGAPPPPDAAPVNPDAVQSNLLSLFNEERTRAGLQPVALHAALTDAALRHATEMEARNVLSHTGANGSNPGQRLTRAGYAWRTWGEIIAMGQPTPLAVLSAWMNSPGHRAIIVGAEFREVGIAKAGAYWCATWGAR
jgi:serine protease